MTAERKVDLNSPLELVESPGGVQVTTTLYEVTHLCPFMDETDTGTLVVQWVTTHRTIELRSLSRYVRTFADQKVSHEKMVHTIQIQLRKCGMQTVRVEYQVTTDDIVCAVAALPSAY